MDKKNQEKRILKRWKTARQIDYKIANFQRKTFDSIIIKGYQVAKRDEHDYMFKSLGMKIVLGTA